MKTIAMSFKRVYYYYQRRSAYACCEKTKGTKRVAKRNTSIRINGKHYDALTGVLLSDTPLEPVHHRPAKSIDGVVSNTVHHRPVIIKPVQAETRLTTPVKSPTKPTGKKIHVAAAHTKAHVAKPSATLMRTAVAKPQPASLKRRAKVQGSTLATAKKMPVAKVTPKASVYRVNAERLARATQIDISPKISRFAYGVATAAPAAAQEALTALNQAIAIPQAAAPQRVVYRPDVSAGAVAVLAIAGFFGMQNLDTIQFKVASRQAGFSATMPSYRPVGFTVDSVRAYNGYVGLKYVADAIDGASSYAITEKPSNWNSATLLTNIQANSNTASYRVVEKAGRTVYLYGNNQAAWVNNGILYQLVSTSELGNHEVGQIAASM
jgi:hypothetical protein